MEEWRSSGGEDECMSEGVGELRRGEVEEGMNAGVEEGGC